MLPRGQPICHALASSDPVRVTLVVVMGPRRVLACHQPHARLGGGPGSHLMRPPVCVGASLRSRLGVSRVFWATGPFLVTLPRPPHPCCASFSGGPYMAIAWANLRPLMGLFPVYANMYMYGWPRWSGDGRAGQWPGSPAPGMALSAVRRRRGSRRTVR